MKKISTNTSRKITKSNKFMSWVICMLLFMVAGIQSVNAQTYNLLNTSGGTVAGTNYNIVMSGNNTSGCVGQTTGLGDMTGSASGTCTINFTSGTPVFYVDFAIDGADNNPAAPALNREIITVNGITHIPSAANFICNGGSCTNSSLFSVGCYSVSTGTYGISGNYLQPAVANTVGRCIYRVSSAVPITQIAITEDQPNNSGGVAVGAYIITGLPIPCAAGIAAPSLSATTIANVCPANTINLTTITASNLPGFTTLTWHTGTPATTANKIATPSAVAAGTYYAAFFDAFSNCYSGTGGNGSATTTVTATVTACCPAGSSAPTLSATTISNVCPTATVNLTSITASNLPGGTTLTWHTATPATTANKIATPSAVTAGTYYAAFFDATNNCYSGIGGNGSATTVVTATTTTCAALTANNPTTQTVPSGQVYTGNAGTELAPTGGTSPYTYSNGSSDPACTNPGGGAVALPPASNLTVTNSTTGAYTYTAPTASGTYFFCIKVCDSTSPTPSCVVKTYTVVVPCAAGSTPPVLIKN